MTEPVLYGIAMEFPDGERKWFGFDTRLGKIDDTFPDKKAALKYMRKHSGFWRECVGVNFRVRRYTPGQLPT